MSANLHCPLCGEPLNFYGDEPSCMPCVAAGRTNLLHAALENPEFEDDGHDWGYNTAVDGDDLA